MLCRFFAIVIIQNRRISEFILSPFPCLFHPASDEFILLQLFHILITFILPTISVILRLVGGPSRANTNWKDIKQNTLITVNIRLVQMLLIPSTMELDMCYQTFEVLLLSTLFLIFSCIYFACLAFHLLYVLQFILFLLMNFSALMNHVTDHLMKHTD